MPPVYKLQVPNAGFDVVITGFIFLIFPILSLCVIVNGEISQPYKVIHDTGTDPRGAVGYSNAF